MSDIDINTLSHEEKAAVVCLYYARLKKTDVRYKDCFTNLKAIATKYGYKSNTLKNNKQAYDALFDNGRDGWHDRPLKKRSKLLYEIYCKYADYNIDELASIVDEIIRESQKDDELFFSIKTRNPATVQAILSKQSNIEFDGLNILQDSIKIGQKVFIVLGGDRPSWKTGLVGIGVISKEPYDIGYSGRNYKICVDVKLLLDKPIKREDLVPYVDTYGIIGIAPITRWEPNQAISQLSEKSAVALMRAMLELSPGIEVDLISTVKPELITRIKGATTKFISVEVNYQERIIDVNDDNTGWWPSPQEYNPNITTEEWVDFLIEDSKTYPLTLKMLGTMLELGGEATCKKLSEVLGGHPSTYISRTTGLGERVKKQFNLPPCMDGEQERFFPIPFLGRHVEGTKLYAWKLRPELRKALEIMDLPDFTEIDETNSNEIYLTPYTKGDFLNDVYIDEDKYDTCVSRLRHKKNLILQGAPGVGKTFAARRLAWSMMGVEDDSRIEFVQFHQSYSYEDFIMGYKPVENGFSLENGIFYDFCIKARNDSEKDYFFIIDEINRGNMSKIFGELLMLIESDYRHNSIKLAYSKKPFSIPKNLYLIGMMNTTDRSLAMIDYALRRRFSFVEMTPGFESEGFKKYQADVNNTAFDRLIGRVKALNSDIENDASLGKGFCIGHSYFCNLDKSCNTSVLKEIVEYDIVPMLEEYWFDDKEKADRWSNDLRGIINE